MLNDENGFTLIEMLIVLAIISVLIILVIPNLSGKSEKLNEEGCKALVAVVQTQVDTYYLEKGNYPKDLNELEEENYITKQQMHCANDKALEYDDGKVSEPN